MKAEALAKSFAARFLENGNYEALPTKLSDRNIGFLTAATGEDLLDDYFGGDEGFAGLAVQSVGFTQGAEREQVIIYVTKGSKRALKALPNDVEGVPVAAQVMGRLKAGPSSASAGGQGFFFEHKGRIACGSSCAPSRESYAGTLGCLARDEKSDRLYALSNNHVFAACNHTPVGMPILSPATADARPRRRAPGAACVFESMVELRSGVPSLVDPMRLDAALALVEDDKLLSSWQGDSSNGFDTPVRTVKPRAGLRVKKCGRTTGLTSGEIEALIPTPWVLPYKSARFSADVWFQDTWVVRSDDEDPFALPGDSGSLVATEDGAAAVGMLFAVNTSGGYAIIFPVEALLRAFGILKLVGNHGL